MSSEKFSFGLKLHKLYRKGAILSFVSVLFIVLLFASPLVSATGEGLPEQRGTTLNRLDFSLENAVFVGDEDSLRVAVSEAEGPTVIALTKDISLTNSALNIPVNKDITLISDNEETPWKLVGANGYSTIVINRGRLTLVDTIVTHNRGANGNGVTVNSGSTLIMNGGKILGNSAENGGGVYNTGTFNMSNTAVIAGNTATKNGGGVYNTGTFNMENGSIGGSTPTEANTATNKGGGVYNSNNCAFSMSDGQILGNKAKQGNDVFNEGTTISGSTIPVAAIFGIVAGIIVVGFAGEFLIKKVGIPIFIFLILAGIVLGPGLNIFPRESLLSTLGLFATLTLLMVLFHAGLGLKTQSVINIGSRVFIQSTIYTLVSMVLLGTLGYFVLKWDFLQAFIFAAIIGGEITAAVIVPLSYSMKLREKTTTFLTLESAISSVFSVVIFATLINIYTTGKSNITDAITGISMQFSAGILIGLGLSVAWVYILHRFQKQKFTHVLTIGLILATYSITTTLGGNGVLAVLVFGIIFGNYHIVNKILKTKINIDKLQQQLTVFYEEISFLLETLFFVSLGLIFVIEPSLLLAGIMFTVVLLMTRFGAVRISTAKSDLAQDKRIITFMCALGLTPATLAILTISYGLPLSDTLVNVVTYVIIFTNIITAVWSTYYLRKKKQNKKEHIEQKEIAVEENK